MNLKIFLSQIILLVLPIYATVFPTPPAELSEKQWKDFRNLVNAIPEQCIHTALQNELVHFKDGVFQYNRAALERIHSQDPALATKLISAAALEAFKVSLSKRQNPNNTTPVVPMTPSPPPTPSLPGQTSLPNAPNSQPIPSPTVSVNVAVTTTDQRGNTITTESPAPAVVITSTNSAGSTILLTSAASIANQPVTTTDSAGSTFVTQVAPSGGQGSSLVIQTTTLPNGQVSTITSYEVVGASPTGASTEANSSGATATGPLPSLQSGAASLFGWRLELEAAALLSLAAGFAWFL